MLIDNRDSAGRPGETKTVADFIRKYTNPALGRVGALDIVTGYFTIAGLDLLYRELSPQNTYRLVLSELADDDAFLSRAIDLLRGDAGIEASLKLSAAAKNAVAFLERATVEVRALTNAFCHAKAYVYTDATDDAHDYFVVGSSNLTEAGLGLHASSNVELNLAQTGRTSAEYASLRRWFRQQWETVAKGAMPVGPRDGSSPEVDVKEYFIARIEECFGRVHTPEEIYYRVLLELFGGELDFAADAVSEREMALLQDSAIYRTLFGYQRKGVVSLIKMLKKWNGAILADAVGLGKTFSALAVIKHFQNNGYQTLLLCPKKLEQNWMQYLRKQGSRFDGDAFDYVVKFHTDLQDDRMERGPVKLSWLLKQRKLLVVVDESHNLRNDKSARYQMLLDRILGKAASDKARDVKVLLLSATPINNGLLDIRNQFRLIARGDNAAFDNEDFQVADLDRLFQGANRRFNEWCQKDGRTIGDFFDTLPSNFFNLTDKLIVARTRRMVENTLGEDLGFPKKLKPANEYVGLDGLGDYPDVTAVYEALLKTNLTAYQPTQYMEAAVAPDERGKDWQDNAYREKSLVKMMAVLFMKRLESCWLSCMTTVEKVLGVHRRTLERVDAYLAKKGTAEIGVETPDGSEGDEFDDGAFTLRDATIDLAKMARIQDFRRGLADDVEALGAFHANLVRFKAAFEAGEATDDKLVRLIEILDEKRRRPNRKALVFTTFGDTAQYLYEQIRKTRPGWRVACVTGQTVQSSAACPPKMGQTDFQCVLQRFAPRAKLYHERDWSDLYAAAGLKATCYDAASRKWKVGYETWREAVGTFDPDWKAVLDAEIDVLIATDCLSEGQNLQDSDLVINYDIHWNPVRLIQRFGRIDRIGSANAAVRAVNFWPTKTYNEYLHLTSRINNRMALMRLAGTETQPTTEELERIVRNDPMVDRNTQKLLDQIAHADIGEIEESGLAGGDGGSVGLQDLSLEAFRQDLVDFYERNGEPFRRMPGGVFSGFRLAPDAFPDVPESLVAVLGYPRRPADGAKRPYRKLYLVLQPVGPAPAEWRELSTGAILDLLRRNRGAATDLPDGILKGDADRIASLSATLRGWIAGRKPAEAKRSVLGVLSGTARPKPGDPKVEDVFRPENFDLIAWEYVSR